MEDAQKQLIFGNYKGAVERLTRAIGTQPSNHELYLFRGVAYTELAKYDLAINDLEKSIQLVPNIFLSHLRLGIALFYKCKFPEANKAFQSALLVAKEDYEKLSITNWMQKCLREEKNTTPSITLSALKVFPKPILIEEKKAAPIPNPVKVPDTPAVSPAPQVLPTAPTPEVPQQSFGREKKADYDWYQSTTHVMMAIKMKGVKPENCKIIFEESELTLSLKLEEGRTFEFAFSLSDVIIPDKSSYTVTDTKIEVKMKKKSDGTPWKTLEREEIKEAPRPAYPTSAKKKINWDKLDKEIEKETAKEKVEGDDALNKLLKAIYEKGSEETRRAMIKSMQTSGGTVLSTNWGEVKEKDYEGRDRPEPPKGQQWVKPDAQSRNLH
eukprot:TRINITY_DN5540_c0_g2_i1.p1 TRINITY_DN5540_c0_g2~~TRINITY_DN5540_c0_g2_i1.p1  ORF type:complete len:382 (-),score=89.33 TRINITY_DN5540_c0_g2_i1:8-1153(-)